MIIICDKNQELIDALQKLDLTNSKTELSFVCGDVIELHKQTPNSRIVTASNPDFNPAGGLDKLLAKKYKWEDAKEFTFTDDLFYIVSVDRDIQANKRIIERALIGVLAYSKQCTMILTGIGTGVGGMSIKDFVGLVKKVFVEAHLREANLQEADLQEANLRGAKNLDKVIYNEGTAFFALQCPEEGSFIGWKKAKDGAIVKLLVTEDAKRSSATSRKCRCSHAQVLAIWDNEGKELQEVKTAYSESKLIYKVDETVRCEEPFEEARWVECGSGIHFFITKREAELYN